MFVTILSVALTLANIEPSDAPARLGGGPDPYGYRYLDSDTVCPGAPTYNWVNIEDLGTPVTGLGDDNVVGPFALGFEFPYYWYKVTSCYIGSNGYIAFRDKWLAAAPFYPVPGTQWPNNTLAPLMSDLDPSPGGSPNGSVWYWTSAGADSFIVQYESIRFWSTGGNNTFQIILSKPDSSVTFQYKEQSGEPYMGWAPENNQTGIENGSGAIGLNYLSGTVPPGNMYHADLAVRFFPPESTTLQVNDAGVRNAMNDRNGGLFAINNRPFGFWAIVKNFGNQPEPEFKTYFRVLKGYSQVVFSDSMMAQPSNPGQTESLALPNTWRPSQDGRYIIKVITKLTGDMLAVNDTATIECRVVTLPADLTYVGWTPTTWASWDGPGGYGCRFVPPVYPCSISSIRMFMEATASTPTKMAIYDDDGPGDSPGTVLFEQTVDVLEWNGYSVNLPIPVAIADGAFFVGATSEISGSPSFGMDSMPPFSLQAWEYAGVWAPSRDAVDRDVCAAATISGPVVGIFELRQPTPTPARIDVKPNPFGSATNIRLLNPRSGETAIEIYDATGSLVRTLSLERGTAAFNGRDARGRILADGVYFARLAGYDRGRAMARLTESPVAKVIISRSGKLVVAK